MSDFNTELDRLTNESRYQAETDYGKYRDQMSDYYAELARLTNASRYESQTDYNRYRDQMSDYYTELDRLTNDSRYQSETEYNRYMDQYNQAYGEYRDSVSDWQQAQDRANAEYWNQYERDYGQYVDDRNLAYDNYWTEQNMAYQQDRDKVSDQQWQTEFDEAKRQYDEQMGLKTAKSSGGSGGTGSTGGGYTKNPDLTKEQIISLQQQAGITADGIWGPQTAAAYDSGFRPEGETEETTIGYKDVVNDIKGMSDAEALAHIEDARKLGYITTAEAKTLSMLYK